MWKGVLVSASQAHRSASRSSGEEAGVADCSVTPRPNTLRMALRLSADPSRSGRRTWPCALGGRSAPSVSGRSIADRSKDFQVRAPPIGRCSIIPGNRSASTASSSLAFTRSSPIRANPSQGRSQRRIARVRGRRRHGERCRSGGIAGYRRYSVGVTPLAPLVQR